MCFLTLKITSFSAKIYNLKPKNPKNLYTPSKHLILPNFYLFTFANHITGKGPANRHFQVSREALRSLR